MTVIKIVYLQFYILSRTHVDSAATVLIFIRACFVADGSGTLRSSGATLSHLSFFFFIFPLSLLFFPLMVAFFCYD